MRTRTRDAILDTAGRTGRDDITAIPLLLDGVGAGLLSQATHPPHQAPGVLASEAV